MQAANGLSFLGRMGYWTHMAFYPAAFIVYRQVYAPYKRAQAEADKKADWDNLIKARPVDPDTFNPFTPIPYHNNPELTYMFSHINMKNYVNQNSINVKEYVWKNYHDSFDHNNAKTHTYNWTRVE